MARYIDAELLAYRINYCSEHTPEHIGEHYAYCIALKEISIAPTADVVEVKHGKWKIKRDDYDCEYMMCSCCKEEFYPANEDTVDITPNYCPNCGAKLKGGDT